MRIAIYVAFSLCCLVAEGFACICAPPPDVKTMHDLALWRTRIDGAKIIFQGTVEKQTASAGPIGAPAGTLSMTINGAHRIVLINATHVFRGPQQEQFTVVTGMGMGDCGFEFDTGKEYLIFADPVGDGEFFTSICAGTISIQQAAPFLRVLNGTPPTPDDLLDLRSYYEHFLPQWTGSVCGHVFHGDGKPFAGATVELTQVRDDPFPPKTEGDPNISVSDGHFCIRNVSPGRYLLTAEDYDWDHGTRTAGFYPGVLTHSQAVPIDIIAGVNIPDLQFRAFKEPIYTVTVKVATADGTPLPWNNVGIAINSLDRDALAYHESHGVDEDGSYTLGGIPAGHYTVTGYLYPDVESGKVPEDARKWQSTKREVDINGNTEVVVTLAPAHNSSQQP